MEIIVFGTRGSYPSASRQMVSFAIAHDSTTLLVDAGSSRVFDNLADLAGIEHVFVSHVHHDHIAMLPHVALAQYMARRSAGKGTMTTIYGTSSLEVIMQSMGLCRGTEYLIETVIPSQLGPFRISSLVTRHSVPCYAFGFQAGGCKVVYTGDTTYFPELAEFCSDADLLICEATYSNSAIRTAQTGFFLS